MGFNIVDFLFGTKPDAKTEQESLYTPEQIELISNLIEQLQGSYGGSEGVDPSGKIPANLAAIQKMFLGEAGKAGSFQDTLRGSLSGILSGEQVTPTAQNLYSGFLTPFLSLLDQYGTPDSVWETLNRLMNADPTAFEEYFQTNVYDPLTEQYEEEIAPQIKSRFAPSGFYSSQRLEAEQNASEDLLDALSRDRARLAYESRESALDRALGAAQAGGQIGVGQQANAVRAGSSALDASVREAASMRGLVGTGLQSASGINTSLLNALGAGGQSLNTLYGQLYGADTQSSISELNNLQDLLTQQMIENIVYNYPGTKGLFQGASEAFAAGAGRGLTLGL